MSLKTFNEFTFEQAREAFKNCCGSSLWVDEMTKRLPLKSEEELFRIADEIWFTQCNEADWLEAFTHHPKIGDVKRLEEKFASTKAWAAAEQESVQRSDANTIAFLAKGNEEYEEKFGFIFIVCATGKSAEEMLQLLNNRLPNSYQDEKKIAMQEQAKITALRLKKLLS